MVNREMKVDGTDNLDEMILELTSRSQTNECRWSEGSNKRRKKSHTICIKEEIESVIIVH